MKNEQNWTCVKIPCYRYWYFVVLDQTNSAVDNEHELLKVNSDIKFTYTSFFEIKE